MPALYDADFTKVRLAPGRMVKAAAWSDLTGTARPDKPWLNGYPRMIFVGDMGDFFASAIPFDYLKAELIDVALSPKGRRHIWMVLTKRPRRLAAFEKWLQTTFGIIWPENIWCGTSITSNATLKRIDALCEVGLSDTTLFVSAEPLREFIDLSDWLSPEMRSGDDCFRLLIIGGESRQKGREPHPFNIGWARHLIHQCRDSGVKPFVKQLGSKPYMVRYNENSTTDCGDEVYFKLKDDHGGDWLEWSPDLRVREFPAIPNQEASANV